MPMAVPMRDDYSGNELRRLASSARDGWQARRVMALAAVGDAKNRAEAAAAGLMDRQTSRDWVIRFNEQGPDGLINKKPPGRAAKLTAKQKCELAQIIEEGPANHVPDLIRWRRIDLVRIVKKRFDVAAILIMGLCSLRQVCFPFFEGKVSSGFMAFEQWAAAGHQ